MPVIFVVGVSYRTAPVEIRERFSADADALPAVLARLSARRELSECMFLSTCNRVEVLSATLRAPHGAADAVREVLAGHVGLRSEELRPYLYEVEGAAAVRHIFRVTSSLDSMVLGEPQILGQVKDAHDAATAAGTLGSFLGRCVTRAFSVAKRVRSETAIGQGSVSISSVAVDLAKHIFGDLANHTVLLVGAGEMAEQAAKSLGKSAKRIRVCNRSFDRGVALAQAFGGDVARWESLESELQVADVVVVSTASPTYVIQRDMVKRVMRARKGRTLFLIDISVPRNVDPACHGVDNVYVFNVDDLEAQVAEGMKARHAELEAAERIVATEVAEFESWARGLAVQPTVLAMRTKMRAILESELERTLAGRLKHLGEGDRAALSQMVESATNKLLHAPTTRLRSSVGSANGADYVTTLAMLFDLPEPDLSGAPSRSVRAGANAGALNGTPSPEATVTTARSRDDAPGRDAGGEDGEEENSSGRHDGSLSAGATSAPVFAALSSGSRLDS